MRSRAEIKQEAKEILRNAKARPWVVTLAMFGLTFALSFVAGLPVGMLMVVAENTVLAMLIYYVAVIAAAVVSMGFIVGYYKYLIGIRRGQEMPVRTLFTGFKQFGRFVGAILLVALKTYLWSLLFVIPGIIAAYRYRFVVFNVLTDDSITIGEAFKRSKAQTDGFKFDLFVFDLSFFGWYLLTGVTFGIAYFWVMPYMMVSLLGVYEDRCKAVGLPSGLGSTSGDFVDAEFTVE